MEVKKNKYSLMALIVLLFQCLISPAVTYADSISGTVHWSNDNTSAWTGTKGGQPYKEWVTLLDVNGQRVFCIEPGVPINSPNESGYVGNPANGNIPRRAKLAMALWDTILDPNSTEDIKITQSVVWGNLEGENKCDVQHIDGISDSVLKEKQKKLNDAITNYDKKPSFNSQTVKLTLGESKEVVNTTDGVNLLDFDKVVSNSANVKYTVQSNKLVVTAVDATKKNGTISFKKSLKEGTPYVYEKAGQQKLAQGAIDDPNNFNVNFDIQTTGDVKIVKVDKETGATVPNTKFHVEFSGAGSPKAQDVITGNDGSATIKDVQNGVHVKATETSVPAPYVLASSNGGSDTVEGVVTAGQTITLTQKNEQEKGQIIVEKKGAETDHNMWNNNYTLKGNVFEIHKDTENGEVVKTIATDEKGHAETSKDLALGTYVVTEKQASNGFANTFKPQTVKLDYKDQTVAVVAGNTSGDNQEVVGSTTITKQDAETGKETQGRASFKGAEYTLFHKDGDLKDQAVKWSETYKPELTIGGKANEDTVTVRINEQSLQAGVKHLALGNYYWKETKAPEGYQIDNNSYDVNLAYKDQNTKVITQDTNSKENVVKFNFGGFKYVTSQNGSAQSGYNGIQFTLTPIDPTKGEQRKVETETDTNGYDGSFNFENIPYGDYKFEEVKAPEGFKTIKTLLINSKYNDAKQEYTFTITEEGQKSPIKILNVSTDKINKGSNVINLSKLFLYDDSVEQPKIGTTLTNDSGDKVIYADGKVKIKDTIAYSGMDAKIGQELTANGVLTHGEGEPVKIDGKEITGTTSFKPEKGEGTAEVYFEFDATKLDAKTINDLTAFETVLDAQGTVVADHKVPHEPNQTIKVNYPSIHTEATYKGGEKTAYPSEKVDTLDKVSYENLDKGTYYVETKALDLNTNKYLSETDSTQKVEKSGKAGNWEIKQVLNTKEAAKHNIVYFEYVYKDKDHKQLVAKHEDKNSKDQTISVVELNTPLIHTNAHIGDGKTKVLAPKKDQAVYDDITIDGLTVGNKYNYDLQLHRLEGDKDKVVYKDTFKFTADKVKIKKTVNTKIDTSKDVNGVKYVWTEQLKDESGSIVANHSDLKDQDETLTVNVEKEVPPTTPKESKNLPKTGEKVVAGLTTFAAIALVGLMTLFVIYRNKESKVK